MKRVASNDTHAHVVRKRPAWTTRPGGRAPRARCTRSSLVLGVLVLAAVVSTRWVRLNVSPSVPLGFYLLEPPLPPLAHGTLVLLPVPASMRPWWHAGAALLKPVAAVAGEEVCGVEGELFVHGEAYGPIYTEADGKPLPYLDGCQMVPQGTVFLASQAPKSLDSRYFNAVPLTAIAATAVPLWTWR